ncbi:MAG: molybdopterin converting factor subunit 1 [Chitinophagaceae bacterium]|nr:MAG: molybdopterin converting factor subunit 1 [Chitinophagaceae bacterium]
MVTILFFAQLREQLNCEKISIDIESPLTLLAILERITQQRPEWSMFLSNEKLLFALNQKIVKSSELVNINDEVAFFPPVTGG